MRGQGNNQRGPQHRGSGIYVHQQFDRRDLVPGDTYCDADYGSVVWDGRDWHQFNSKEPGTRAGDVVWNGTVWEHNPNFGYLTEIVDDMQTD